MCELAGEPPSRAPQHFDCCGGLCWSLSRLRNSGKGWRVGEGLCGVVGLDFRDGSALKRERAGSVEGLCDGGRLDHGVFVTGMRGLWSGVGDRAPGLLVWAREKSSCGVERTCGGRRASQGEWSLDSGGQCKSGWCIKWALRCDSGCRMAACSSAGAATTMGNWASATQTAEGTRRARWQAPPSA